MKLTLLTALLLAPPAALQATVPKTYLKTDDKEQ